MQSMAEQQRPSTPPLTPPRDQAKGEAVIVPIPIVMGAIEEIVTPGREHPPEEEEEGNEDHETDVFGRNYPTARRAATGEAVPISGSVLPGIGTVEAPIQTARAALHIADEMGALPPRSVVERGAEMAGEEQERRSIEGVEKSGERKHFRKDEEKFEVPQVGEEKPAEAEHIPGEWNVSQRVDPSRYDPRVPYIAGFSNGIEITDPIILETKFGAEFPKWLRGAYYRNGPGLFDIEYLDKKRHITTFSFEHWFDGLPLVHRFQIDGAKGEVQYRSRFTATTLENLIREYGRKTHKTTDTDLGRLGLSRMESDPSAVAVNFAIQPGFPIGHGLPVSDHLVLTTDSTLLQEIDPVTLIPKRAFRYEHIHPAFKGEVAAAVAARDIQHKILVNYAMEYLANGHAKYTFFGLAEQDRFDPPGHLMATITGRPTHAHSIALTKHYVVLVAFPFTTTWRTGFRKVVPWLSHPSPSSPSSIRKEMYFDPHGHTTFHVIDRDRREEVCIFRTGPMYALNIINAFETDDGQTVCIDMNTYDNDEILRCWDLRNLRTSEMPPWPGATVRRYVLSKIPEASTVYKVNKSKLPEPFFTHRTDFTLEWPRINPDSPTHQYNYAWGLSISPEKRKLTNVVWDTIVKANVAEKSRIEWRQEGCYPGEPIMIPNREAEVINEDNGVVLSIVLDTVNNNISFLLVLDAATMQELGRANLPVHVPFGFHGMLFAALMVFKTFSLIEWVSCSGAWTQEVHG
ncbi:uncharacterized protein SPPG_05143 [Spizellomyces punctatus DAOM BR117]|uniref:Carotenoid oxygenase n=1 Tax=Spizellomyces punctatus (strain DAOM BR117) TaxID=645134 RepID=A0A0L0HF72_SPIPD|nr:uncharacterized protein SPPG_05143 [Spizellomyces punctatus DAOM BR117]KNC99767.1 hypothetical protein SPPG_05143 [Spizellomyces punctatus DAOM BR117]|eukprot:XP_016607807.1 hypothetical protein SPPG_05143 [Spizellomyces punctatus DAOM BR117]